MDKINWKVRLNIFNFKLEFGETVDKILVFITVLFAFLVLIGVVNDPTTAGLSDSSRALEYHVPNED